MKIGKVPNNILNELVLNKIKHSRPEVLIRPKIGEDCCAVDFGENVCVLSTDPITGAKNEVGRLAVHVTCNDVASCGVEPIGMLVTILAPPETTESDLDIVMSQLCETANSLNVEIIGGHTEITTSVSRFVIISTALGRIQKGKLVTTSGAKPGDDIIITKSAGIEGTAIIAHDKEKELAMQFGNEIVEKAKSYINSISVVKEGIISGEFGVTSMHDVTEGGLLGAVWEVAEASDTGLLIYEDRIPLEHETKLISEYFKINPLKLISSGSMIITCENGQELVNKLGENDIKATVIGKITEAKDKKLVSSDKCTDINLPETDELYKVIG